MPHVRRFGPRVPRLGRASQSDPLIPRQGALPAQCPATTPPTNLADDKRSYQEALGAPWLGVALPVLAAARAWPPGMPRPAWADTRGYRSLARGGGHLPTLVVVPGLPPVAQLRAAA